MWPVRGQHYAFSSSNASQHMNKWIPNEWTHSTSERVMDIRLHSLVRSRLIKPRWYDTDGARFDTDLRHFDNKSRQRDFAREDAVLCILLLFVSRAFIARCNVKVAECSWYFFLLSSNKFKAILNILFCIRSSHVQNIRFIYYLLASANTFPENIANI